LPRGDFFVTVDRQHGGMRRVGLVFAWLYTWVIFIPILAVLTMFCGTFAWLLGFVSVRAGSYFGVVWGRLVVATALTRVRVHGREQVERGRQYVIMSNHRSHFDALLLYGYLGLNFLWVMKKELRKVPFLGPACARIGHIFINRKDHAQAVQALRDGLARASGSSVLFFPEGTRSSTREMLPFKKGGFVLAADAGLPILPLSVRGSERVLPNRSLLVRPFRTVDITFHAPVPAPADAAARDALMTTVRARIASALDGEGYGRETSICTEPQPEYLESTPRK
jgi:1-acyl-sn-glycerol-3-phosphate acyltransferase